jgi:hypothetical protein
MRNIPYGRSVLIAAALGAVAACGDATGSGPPPKPVPGNPVPVVSSLSTDTASVGSPATTVVVTGSGFLPQTEIHWQGQARPTTYESPTRVSVIFTPSDLGFAVAVPITAHNPAPGGGTSQPVAFSVRNPVPQITSLSSEGAVPGSASFRLSVFGVRFAPGATVRWNGEDRPTQPVGTDRLDVEIAAADVAAAGTAVLTVANLAPGGGISGGRAFAVRQPGAATATVRRIPVPAFDVKWNPRDGRLYATVREGALANRVVAIDPATGQVVGSVDVGEPPRLLALSDEGRVLHVTLDGSGSIRRVDLPGLSVGPLWQVGTGLFPGDLAAVPGQPESVAVVLWDRCCSLAFRGVAVYDNGVARPVVSDQSAVMYDIEFAGVGEMLFGFNSSTSLFAFVRARLRPDGVEVLEERRGVVSGFYTTIAGASGRIYASSGAVVDLRGVAQGSFPVSESFLYASAVAPDPATGRVFFYRNGGIETYDLNTRQLLGTIPVGVTLSTPLRGPWTMARFGTDGIAFPGDGELVLVQSPIIAP